ncbi:MAG: hypothetical protein ACPG5T_03460, partial [Endozoicomonas sp.]
MTGRGNAAGAAARPTDLDDVILDSAAQAVNSIQFAPQIQTTDEPTYSEFLEAYPSPVGGSELLFSGTDPVDPGDCDLYPDSPLCGGSILDPGAIRGYGLAPLTGGTTVTVSPTEFSISVNYSLFGVPLPPTTIGFRRGDARQIVEDYWRQPTPTITNGFQQVYGGPGCSIVWIFYRDNYREESELARFQPGRHIDQNHQNVVFSHDPPEFFSGTARTEIREWVHMNFDRV